MNEWGFILQQYKLGLFFLPAKEKLFTLPFIMCSIIALDSSNCWSKSAFYLPVYLTN